MKVEDFTQQVPVQHPGRERVDQTDSQSASSAKPAAEKVQPATDKVQLSGRSPKATDNRDQEVSKAQRLQALKASVASGSYQVPARAVAESMLNKIATGATKH
jgi:flagellar biosynthesis anti-sigma factor FlgM